MKYKGKGFTKKWTFKNLSYSFQFIKPSNMYAVNDKLHCDKIITNKPLEVFYCSQSVIMLVDL